MPRGHSRNPEVTSAKRRAIMRGNSYSLGRVRPESERIAISVAKQRPLEERFWKKVDRRGPDDCWLWTAGLNQAGYGSFGISSDRETGISRTGLAHRVSYELTVGPIPSCSQRCYRSSCLECLTIDHVCQTRACVNPLHLELVTHEENRRRGHARQQLRLFGAVMPQICSVTRCERTSKSRGLCDPHYKRWWRRSKAARSAA